MMDKREWLTTLAAGALLFGSAAVYAQSAASEWEQETTTDQQAAPQEEPAGQQQAGQGQQSQELQQLAEEHQDLKKFVEAVESVGMADSLAQGRYTIFAPTDQAFEQSGKSLDELMQPENREELISLLRAHIVADDVDAQRAAQLGVATTIDGGTVELQGSAEDLQVGDARVVQSDIQQGSMRIFAIDQVLEPGAAAGIAAADETGTGTAGTQPEESATGGMETAGTSFEELDADGDGYLSDEELQASQQDIQQDQLDTDADGRVSRSEFAAFEGGEMQEAQPSEQEPTESGTTSEWEEEPQDF